MLKLRAQESPAQHARATVMLAVPIAAALLSEMAMGLISTIMLGAINDTALAAGGLAGNVFFTALIILQGVLSGVGVLAAAAIGGGRPGDVPAIYWSGVLLGALLAIPLFAVLSDPLPLLHALGEPESLVTAVGAYLRIIRWGVPAGVVGIGMMRQFLPAVGLQRVLLWVLPCGVVLHFGLNLLLVRGIFGIAGHGLAGSALATVITLWAMALGMLAILHGGRFHHTVRMAAPNLALLRRMLLLGVPVGLTVMVEVGLFLGTAILAGQLGAVVLAAHMIALNVSSVTFMVPMAIAQAANVRVAGFYGADNLPSARRAGLSAICIAAAFMLCAAALLKFGGGLIVLLYLGPANAANAATSLLAVRLLAIAGVFQLADGTQSVAGGALRGLHDVRIPMIVATIGYWGVGFGLGWYLGFHLGLGAIGLWWGICAGLACVAVGLVARFLRRSARA